MATHSSILAGKSHGQRSLVEYNLWGQRFGHDWSNLVAAAETGLLSSLIVILEHKRAKLAFLGSIMTCSLLSFWQHSRFVPGRRELNQGANTLGWASCSEFWFSEFHSSIHSCEIGTHCLASLLEQVSLGSMNLLFPACCLGSKVTHVKRKSLGRDACWLLEVKLEQTKEEEQRATGSVYGGFPHSSRWVSRKTDQVMTGQHSGSVQPPGRGLWLQVKFSYGANGFIIHACIMKPQ